ncbi:hypothetical protein BDV96DRAFT_371443 [Lophiotrema nucula]|uniref:Uncharacterized protein n=1 Tax=Lophiotrema nucula TaxID=690887 RepID=A0A6A5ZJC7_9PLEO|nr:hypothetical protein BDV96DRAFT_371443 [Lophiotrema nucula]
MLPTPLGERSLRAGILAIVPSTLLLCRFLAIPRTRLVEILVHRQNIRPKRFALRPQCFNLRFKAYAGRGGRLSSLQVSGGL